MSEWRVFLTGGASGIGRATVRVFREKGAEVIVADCVEPQDHDGVFIPLDLADEQSIETAVKEAGGHAPFDAFCNIAGVAPQKDNSLSCLVINALNTFALTERILPQLKKSAPVVSIASRAGLGWQQNMAQVEALLACRNRAQVETLVKDQGIQPAQAYILSKQAMIVWSLCQAAEQMGQYRFNTISPAAVSTTLLQDFISAFGTQTEKNIALVGGAGTPEAIAYATVFLASSESFWINGIDLVVDGGMGAALFAKESASATTFRGG